MLDAFDGHSAVFCLLQSESFKIRCHVDTFSNSPSYILPSADGDKYEGEFENDLDEGNVTYYGANGISIRVY
jgi:hypothetical protein